MKVAARQGLKCWPAELFGFKRKQFPVTMIEIVQSRKGAGFGRNILINAKCTKGRHSIPGQVQSGPGRFPVIMGFDNRDVVPIALQGNGRRQTGDAAADNQNFHFMPVTGME